MSIDRHNVTVNCILCGEQWPLVVYNMRLLWLFLEAVRCTRCGGSIIATEDKVVKIRPPETYIDEEPHRGRPPKWLVEKRRREALESEVS